MVKLVTKMSQDQLPNYNKPLLQTAAKYRIRSFELRSFAFLRSFALIFAIASAYLQSFALIFAFKLYQRLFDSHSTRPDKVHFASFQPKLTQRCLLLDRTAWGSSQATYCWTVQSRPYNSSTLQVLESDLSYGGHKKDLC